MHMLRITSRHWIFTFFWRPLCLLSVLLIAICFIITPVKANEIGLENKIKAAFLANFMLYVENREKDKDVRYLCLYDKEKFGKFIHQVVEEKNKKYNNLIVNISYISLDQPVDYCHAVFISSIDTQFINLKDFPKDILTIGEVPGFLLSGGMINFFIEDDSVYFAINLDVMNRRGVLLSSQLLKLARINKNNM